MIDLMGFAERLDVGVMITEASVIFPGSGLRAWVRNSFTFGYGKDLWARQT